jgi:hypothetical protein
VLDREEQLGVARELTATRAWGRGRPARRPARALITESPDGGWGIGGHANAQEDIDRGSARRPAGASPLAGMELERDGGVAVPRIRKPRGSRIVRSRTPASRPRDYCEAREFARKPPGASLPRSG